MRAGLNSGMYSSGASLPPRLSALLSRVGRNYADGGAVPQGASMATAIPAAAMPQQPGMQNPNAPMPGSQLQIAVKQAIAANPQMVQQLQQVIQEAMQSGELTPDQLNMAIEMAKTVVQNPALYPRLRQMLIERGIATEQELPPQYDQGIIFAFLLMAEAVQGQLQGGGGAPAGPPARMADGGSIPVSASPTDSKSGRADDIPINVSGGEYVIPKHVVAAKGTEYFDRMLEQYDPNNPDSKVNKA